MCPTNDWRTISAHLCRTNEWRAISARYVHTNEWRAVGARHVVVNVMSRLERLQGETWVDKGLRGRCRNSPSHLSLILAGDFWSRTVQGNISHTSVMFRREFFGEVIGKIFSSLLPVEVKIFFLDTTSHPVEAHVKCFGAFPAHVASEDAVGGCVVSLDWSGRLHIAHFNQGHADGNILLAVEEYCTGSDSAAYAMTVRMVWNLVRIRPFGVGLGRMEGRGGVSLRYLWPAARLCALGYIRYAAALSMCRSVSHIAQSTQSCCGP